MEYRPRYNISPIYGETNNLRSNNTNTNQNSNEDNNNDKRQENNNNDNNNNFVHYSDQEITINYSNCCKTPYFAFGKLLVII